MKNYLLIFSLFLNDLFSADLSQNIYDIKAQAIIDSVKSFGNGMPDDLKDFLETSKSNAEKIHSDNFNINEASMALNFQFVFMMLIDHIDTDSSARFLFEFVRNSNILMEICIKNELPEFENACAEKLEKIEKEKHDSLQLSWDLKFINTILIREAGLLADAILNKLNI